MIYVSENAERRGRVKTLAVQGFSVERVDKGSNGHGQLAGAIRVVAVVRAWYIWPR